jgi:DNA invertase Pin-like site-specific DNA recombinase
LGTTRQWTVTGEHLDEGISGSKDRRPALDAVMVEARRGRIDVVCIWSLDRFGRSLAHVVTAVQELHERGVAFVSLNEGLDFDSTRPTTFLSMFTPNVCELMRALRGQPRVRFQQRGAAGR